MQPICTGFGSSDTHAIKLNDGRTNSHPNAGQPYTTISETEVFALLQNPPSTEKSLAQWIIPSAYHQYDARSHDAQRERGEYWYLAADIDQGAPTLEQVETAVSTVLGDAVALVYATRSATEHNPKWRALIPLAEPISGAMYSAYQASLFDALEYAGLVLDRSLERPGQLVYLPNRGDYYAWGYVGYTQLLDPHKHPMAKRAKMYADMAAQATSGSGAARKEGARSHLAAFRRKHSIEELLVLYGYQQRGNSDHWRSPYQQSGSYGTLNLGDAWFSLSQSDADAGLGRASKNGRYGDQFDLYLHYTCAGLTGPAEAYARQCLQEEDDARYGTATAEHGAWVWNQICMQRAEEAKQRALAVQSLNLGDKEGNNDEWDIGWPPGLVGELAQWIYASSSRPVKQYAIAAALYFFSVAGRKYNVDGKGLNLYMMLVGGTGRGKGIVKTAVDRVVDAIVKQGQDPSLGGPFSYEVAVSEAGIRKGLAKQNPMCAYEEELGLTLLPLTSPKASSNDIGLRKVLTRLFDSGEGSKLGIKQASSQDNTKDMVYMPCMTLAGDTQPPVFRALLGNGMLDTGFAPRMVPFFYYGKRSYHNKQSDLFQVPDPGMVDALKGILEYCIRSSEVVVHVRWDPAVKAEYEKLDIEYTDRINAGEVGAEMFNRAGIIVSRVAGILAVGVNHLDPVITRECYEYAKSVIWQGLEESQRILATGGGGIGESVRLFHLREAVEAFFKINPDTKIRAYKTPKAVVDSGHLINERYFLLRFKSNTDFAPIGNGTTEQTIRETLDEAVRQEILEIATDLILDKRTKQNIYQLGPNY